jgi:hypothetical protein
MAGKKGRSGPPGNTNGVRHPWRLVIRRGGLPAEYRTTLQPYLTRYGDELARDKGSRDNLTAAKRGLIDIIQASRAAWMIALIEAGKRGFIRDITAGTAGKASWDLAPGFKEASRYMQLERQALSTSAMIAFRSRSRAWSRSLVNIRRVLPKSKQNKGARRPRHDPSPETWAQNGGDSAPGRAPYG